MYHCTHFRMKIDNILVNDYMRMYVQSYCMPHNKCTLSVVSISVPSTYTPSIHMNENEHP